MTKVAALTRLGGVAGTHELLRLTGRASLRRALSDGRITRTARGRYAVPTAKEAARAASELHGVVCLRSAAAHHGWPLKEQPALPEVAVPRGRRVARDRRERVRVVWMDVAGDDRAAGVTSPLRTVIHCARRLPFDQALAIADSALRSELVTRAELAAVRVRGAGASPSTSAVAWSIPT